MKPIAHRESPMGIFLDSHGAFPVLCLGAVKKCVCHLLLLYDVNNLIFRTVPRRFHPFPAGSEGRLILSSISRSVPES